MTNDITLYGKQFDIFNDWLNSNKHCITVVPVGSGKSFLAAIFLPIAATNPSFHKGRDIVYSAPTMTMCKTVIWPSLINSCKTHFGITDDSINNTDMTIKFPAGNYIRCKSAEQRLNLRGINAAIWVADEASLYTEETLQEITNRLRPAVGQLNSDGRLIVITTPHGNGPLKQLLDAALLNPDKYIVHHYNYIEMGSGNLDYILEQKRILSTLKFNQDFMCTFDEISDQVFYEFNRNLHTDQLTDTGYGDLYTAHDFNKRVACAIVCRVTDPYTANGKIEVLKAYSIDNCGTEQMAQAIRADFPKRRIYSVIDMSGAQLNRDTTSPFGVTDRTLLEKYGFVILNTNKANPLIGDTDNSSNSFIRQGRLTIELNQSKMIEAMSTYHYEDGSRKKLVKYNDRYAFIDGLGDAMRYLIHTLFPIVHHDNSVQGLYRGNKLPNVGIEHMPDSPLFPGGPTWDEIENGDIDTGYRGWN